jgi:hypothetical protein
MSKTGYVYEIYSLDKKMRYFGSTTQQVCKRIGTHNADYKRWKDGKINFTSSYLIIECGEWNYKTIEKVLFDEPFELKNRERYYIETFDCVNKRIPNRSPKESSKNWRDNNKEKKREYDKEHYETNKGKVVEQAKEYYHHNKEEINKKKREKITCECGCIISRDSLTRHKKSKSHLKWLESQS